MTWTQPDPGQEKDVVSVDLWEFLNLVAVALGRGKITKPQAATAMLVALTCKSKTGEDATVPADQLSVELGISVRQVWRHFKTVRDAGWFHQTGRPTRGYDGQVGRKARFRLTDPCLNLASDPSSFQLPDATGEAASENRTSPESDDSFAPNRMTVSGESDDIAPREPGTVPPLTVPPLTVPPTVGSDSSGTTDRARTAGDDAPGIQVRDPAALARAALRAAAGQ